MSETPLDETTPFDLLNKYLAQEDLANFRIEFFDLPLYEQAQFYLTLDKTNRQVFYHFLSPKELGNLFDTIEEDHDDVLEFLSEMRPSYAAEMLSQMYTDNIVDLLNELPKQEKAKYLSLMDKEDAETIKTLLHYEDDTAGAIMTTEYVAIRANQSCQHALEEVKAKAKEAELIYYLFVVNEENQLVGVLSLRDLLTQIDGETLVSDIMSERVISVKVSEDQEDVAKTIRDYNFLAVPVVDFEDHLLGIITVDDIIDVIDEEAVSDYSGLAGVNVEEVTENPFKSSLKRLPWLITLLFLGMSTASLISHYEELVSQASILAVFISLITGTAGNAGTQSLAVAVRRLAIDDDRSRSFVKLILNEILTGFFTGLVTGVTIFIVVGLWKHNFLLGMVIGVSMLCAITVANLAGSLIPLLMDKLGFDPAVASGPFITTLSDLTSVLIYFNIAAIFLQYFLHQ